MWRLPHEEARTSGGHTEEPGLWVRVEAWNRTGEGAGGASLEKSQPGVMGTPSVAALGCREVCRVPLWPSWGDRVPVRRLSSRDRGCLGRSHLSISGGGGGSK